MKRLSAFLGLVAIFLVLIACKKGEGGKCGLNKDCKDNLVCVSETQQCATLDQANAMCASSSDCKARGWCKATSNVAAEELVVCTAKSDEDCKQADCAKDGCTFQASTHTCAK